MPTLNILVEHEDRRKLDSLAISLGNKIADLDARLQPFITTQDDESRESFPAEGKRDTK